MLLLFPPRAACPDAKRDMQSLLGDGLALQRLEVIFLPLLRRKLREKQAARVRRKWLLLSEGTHNYSFGRTEAVHLPEMRERTAIGLVVSTGWE